MIKSRIFIASSEAASVVAEALRDELTTDYSIADAWKDTLGTGAGQTKIEIIEWLARRYDFAIVILTKTDMLSAGPNAQFISRDNCVFEAGLFMGTIGRRRCFFLSSVEKNALPSDLEGILFYHFEEPANLKDREKCHQTIRQVSGFMKDMVQQVREQDIRTGVSIRPLLRDELLEREQLDPLGELQEDQVVVAALQPLELTYDGACQVRENLDNNIRYVYVFRANIDTADKVPQLLWLLLLAGGILPKGEDSSFQRRRELVKANKDKITDALKDIVSNDKLDVYFLDESIDIEYSIHNAASDKVARLYLKRGEEYVEWKSNGPAYDFWNDMRQKKGVDNPDPGKAIFHGTRNFELKKGPFLNNLTMGMRKYFPDFGDQVLQICLGPASSALSTGAASGVGGS